MEHEERKAVVHRFLEDKGFKHFGRDKYKDADLYQRTVNGTDKHSTHVWEWDVVMPNGIRLYSYEIEMTFETQNEQWAQIKYYSISPEDLIDKLEQLSQNLYNCVVQLKGNPKHYRYNGVN
jgi:hypothetical protein